MNCKSSVTTKEYFEEKGIFDKFYNILKLGDFRKDVIRLTNLAKTKYNVDEGNIYTEDDGGKKAVPNFKVFSKIDGIKTYNEKVKDNIAKEELIQDLKNKIEEETQSGITKEGDSNTNIEELYQKAMNIKGEDIENKLNECL
tara:strand:- start:972 stop:1397 length:426 start_codon:yes stop_codon:yes gene_type:complete